MLLMLSQGYSLCTDVSVLLSPCETKEGVNWVGRTRRENCDVVVEAMAAEERFCLGQTVGMDMKRCYQIWG